VATAIPTFWPPLHTAQAIEEAPSTLVKVPPFLLPRSRQRIPLLRHRHPALDSAVPPPSPYPLQALARKCDESETQRAKHTQKRKLHISQTKTFNQGSRRRTLICFISYGLLLLLLPSFRIMVFLFRGRGTTTTTRFETLNDFATTLSVPESCNSKVAEFLLLQKQFWFYCWLFCSVNLFLLLLSSSLSFLLSEKKGASFEDEASFFFVRSWYVLSQQLCWKPTLKKKMKER
jgi:hypothetical protein